MKQFRDNVDCAYVGYASSLPGALLRTTLRTSACMASRKLTSLLVCIVLFCFTGCDFEGLDEDGFGRVRSTSGYGTIDGISGFVHILKSRGLDVRQASRISPQIERYDTIIWAPDRAAPPSQKAVKRLERWVKDGQWGRRVVFIGPGFRSRKLLDKQQVALAKDELLERAIRRYHEKLIRSDYDFRINYWLGGADGEKCDWYELKSIDDQPIKNVSGTWSDGIKSSELNLYTGIYDFKIPADLKPSPATDNRAEVLLKGDGHNLVYRIPGKYSYYNYYANQESDDNGIFVVANGSFIQNYGLISPANQKLANKVADVCSGDVLVLQSGPRAIEVTESLAPEQNGWAWLRQRPLREIVPFFLLLATFTFFVVFPIHGRPKRIRLHPEKTFADHIRATGQLLKASKGRDWAKNFMQKYHGSSSDKKSGQ